MLLEAITDKEVVLNPVNIATIVRETVVISLIEFRRFLFESIKHAINENITNEVREIDIK